MKKEYVLNSNLAINEQMYYYVKYIFNYSFWSKNQDLNRYLYFLQLECDELIRAIRNEDYLNIEEELADVCMMLLFVELEREKSCCNKDVVKGFTTKILKNISNLTNRKNHGFIKKIEDEDYFKCFIDFIGCLIEDYNLTSNLNFLICKKLENRYPDLLPIQQIGFDFLNQEEKNWKKEEETWKKQKDLHKLLYFSTCTNQYCKKNSSIYDGYNLELINTSSNLNKVKCMNCGKVMSLNESILFYTINKKINYDTILLDIKKYFCGLGNKMELQFSFTPKEISIVKNECFKKSKFLKRLIFAHYRIELSDREILNKLHYL